MIIDTHSHCYFDRLAERIPDILENMQMQKISLAVQIGCDIETSQKAIFLAEKYEKFFRAVVGLHPEFSQNEASFRDFFPTENFDNFENFLEKINVQDENFWNEKFREIPLLRELENLVVNHRKNIVAIGECGLDFHYLDGTNGGKIPFDAEKISPKAKMQIENQKFWWLAQWKLAQKYNFPLVIHTRDARDATAEMIKKYNFSRLVMHCYAENPEMARELLDFSDEIYFSFSGIVTYKNAKSVQETAKIIPENRILVETDAPFLAPQPVRGKQNEPANTRFTLEKIAELRGENLEKLEEKIYKNSLRFYGLEGKL